MLNFSPRGSHQTRTTSPPPGRTIRDGLNSYGPHGALIVTLSGHDCVSIPHTWTYDVTTRACHSKAFVNAVRIITSSLHAASIIPSDISVVMDPDYTAFRYRKPRKHQEPHDATARCSVRASECASFSSEYNVRHQIRQGSRPRHAQRKSCWNFHTTAATRVLVAARQDNEELSLCAVAMSVGYPGAASSR